MGCVLGSALESNVALSSGVLKDEVNEINASRLEDRPSFAISIALVQTAGPSASPFCVRVRFLLAMMLVVVACPHVMFWFTVNASTVVAPHATLPCKVVVVGPTTMRSDPFRRTVNRFP